MHVVSKGHAFLRNYCADNLAQAQQKATVLEARSMHSVQNIASSEADSLLPDPERLHAAIEQTLERDWKEILGVEQISVDANFFELGGNSLLAMKAISKINESLERHLPLSTLFDHPTIESLTKFLASKEEKESKSLVPIKPVGKKIPLYLIGYIGGSVDRFCEFAYMLGSEQPVYGLQTPLSLEDFNSEGFNVEELASNYIKNTASQYLSEIMKRNPDGPFAIAGYSYGGFIAFEMARQIEQMDKKVALLALFDTVIPGTKKCLPPKTAETSFKGFSGIEYKAKFAEHKFRVTVYDQLFLLKYDGRSWLSKNVQLFKHIFFRRNRSELQIETSADSKELAIRRNALASLAKKNYELEFYDGEMVLFRARRRSTFSVRDLTLGWKPYARSIKVYKIDGDHFSMFKPFYCKRLARLLQQVLDNRNKA